MAVNDAGVVLHPNHGGIEKLAAALKSVNKQTLDDVFKVLRTSAEEYRRRVQRVSPVKTGRMRASWVVQTERNNKEIQAVVGTSIKSDDGVPYPVHLEFGTARIAGGRVLAWSEGDEPILEWPAKMAGIPNFSSEKSVGKAGSAKFERSVRVAQAAMTVGTGEQMPMLRPIGFEMAPRIIEALLRTIHGGLKDGLDGKKF